MSETLLLIEGSTFFLTDGSGDVVPQSASGLFAGDVRHLSRWNLLIDGQPMQILSSRNTDYATARIYGTLAEARFGQSPPVAISRTRHISDKLSEEIVVCNFTGRPRSLVVELIFEADFCDIFEVKTGPSPADGIPPPSVSVRQRPGVVEIDFRQGTFHRTTELSLSRPFQLDGNTARFEVWLDPRGSWTLEAEVACRISENGREPNQGTPPPALLRPPKPSTSEVLDRAPRLLSDDDLLVRTYRQSLEDLNNLRFRVSDEGDDYVPAAGLPWFMALFGRDSLIAAYQSLPFVPDLARACLRALTRYQATERDDFRDAEPGKILHELRRGRLATLGITPHTPYYGSHDATPLFLILLDEYELWTGDTELVNELEAAALAALAWMDESGDLDGDGFLEYQSRSSAGLYNHCWKDSSDSMAFADGRLARPPIATCEIQGYAYDARRRLARLSRDVWDRPDRAVELESSAERLKEAFNREFWNKDRGHYVLALDAEKRQVDSLTSNVGHVLWSGIADEGRALATANSLMSPELFTGWGLRTMSSIDAAYNPISYHNGSVWPHDTGMAAEGLRRYGFNRQAAQLVTALLECAASFGNRLPEVFAGFDRSETDIPVEYPTASRPQAWAAGAPLLAVRTLLEMDAGEDLNYATRVGDQRPRLALARVPFRGTLRATVS